MSKELRQMVKKIQFERSLTIDEVAKSIKYSRVHLQREMKKEGHSPVIDILKEKYKDLLQNVSQVSKQIIDIQDQEPSKELSSLIESNLTMARSIERNSTSLADLVQMLKEKSVPVNLDVLGLVETLRQLDAKVNLLLRPHIEQAEEELKKEAGRFVNDRDKEAFEIARKFRQSGKPKPGKPGK